MSVVILDEGIVHYEVLGRGRPVIFLHGWIGSWRYWLPAMQTASASFRCYALDLWGFGDTTHDAGLYPLEKQFRLVDDFLIRMGLIQEDQQTLERSGKIAIVSHGLGALIAALYTMKYPALIDRLMVVNLPLDVRNINPRLRSPASAADLADWLLGHDQLSTAVQAEAVKTDADAVIASMTGLGTLDFLSIVSRIQNPCLMVYGQNDPAINLPSEAWLISKPVYMHQIILENSAHFPMIEENSRFTRLMLDFLSLQSGASPADLQLKDEWKRRVR